ncbi:MAG: hypothetical protein AB7D00_03620 [Rhodospirillaceae bacterium]
MKGVIAATGLALALTRTAFAGTELLCEFEPLAKTWTLHREKAVFLNRPVRMTAEGDTLMVTAEQGTRTVPSLPTLTRGPDEATGEWVLPYASADGGIIRFSVNRYTLKAQATFLAKGTSAVWMRRGQCATPKF